MSKLKMFRESKKITQERMARAINVTLSYYSLIERGKAPAGRGFIVKMKATYPEIDISDMFFSDENMA